MTIESAQHPPWLATVLLAEDDTEESVMGSDWHQEAILEAHSVLLAHAEQRAATGAPPWYVSSQVTVIVSLPRRARPWQPKPDLFVVTGLPPAHRSSYDVRRGPEGAPPMPQFVLEVASESTWREDVESKRDLYALTGVREYVVFDPTGEFLPERVRAWRAGASGFEDWRAVRRADGAEVWRSPVLGLELRAEGPLLRFDEPGRGPLWLHREALERWQAAEEAREAAEKRARAAEQALADLRQRLQEHGQPEPGREEQT
jgi:Uma2 family endonuclease